MSEFAEVQCPRCGTDNDFDIENEGIVCEGCDAILNIYIEDGKYKASVV